MNEERRKGERAQMTKEQTTLPAVVKNAINSQQVDLSQVNFLMPTQTFGQVLGEFDKVIIEIVKVDPNPLNGDVFEVSRGKFVPGKRPLMAISNALGIIWYPKETRIVESTERKSRARATGAMRKPNGEWISITEEKTVDLDAIEEEQRIGKEEEAAKGCPYWANGSKHYQAWKSEAEKQHWINHEVRRALLSYRKFKDERAMTGAKERVIREFVALKNHYTAQELSRPLAFPRVITDTSKMLETAEGRKLALDRMTGSVQSIFGPASQQETEVDYEVIRNGGQQGQIEAPAAEEEENLPPFGMAPEKAPEQQELEASLAELRELVEISYLHKDAKALAEDILAQENPNLDAVNGAIDRITEWLALPDVVQKYGQYKGGQS
jgi:hypothetical protein